MRTLLLAFQFLTIIPLPFSVRCEEKDLGRSMAFFPLVGLALGGLLCGADYLLAPVLPRALLDLILIALLTLVTGALHMDGLADVCDGLAARGSRERFLEVMKDPRVGAVGAVALLLGLALKYQALLALPLPCKRGALLLFPALARFSQVQLTVGSKRARSDGLGAAMIEGAGGAQLLVSGAIAALLSFVLLGRAGVYCFLLLPLLTWAIKGWAHRRLGGITGDVIGCTSELNEIFCLLLLLVASGGGH